MAAKHILVFEDEPQTIQMLKTLLGTAGYRVSGVENANIALEIVVDDPPDLLICDLGVPGIDGFQLMRMLKHDRKFTAPVLVVSGHSNPEDRRAALAAGADAFMAKPVDKGALLEKVAGLLSATP